MIIVGAAEPALTFLSGSTADCGLSAVTASVTADAALPPLNSAAPEAPSSLPAIPRDAVMEVALTGLFGDACTFPVATPLSSAERDESHPYAVRARAIDTSNVDAFIF
jgi:hypothetical protein